MTTTAPDRIDLSTLSITDDRMAKLREDFPEVFRDGTIDFDSLKRSLGISVDPGKERFGLNWPGKAECMRVIQEPSVGTLVPDRAESVDFDTTKNLIIEGDNLEVLKLLQKSYYGKIKMIYIDPPYNRGSDFVYPDSFKEGLHDYLRYSGQIDRNGLKLSTNSETDGRYHSNWLSMMYPRLFLARNLLCDTGAIFISIDEREVRNLQLIMNELFGEENFVTCIANVNNPKGRSDDKFFPTAHEYILVYKKAQLTLRGLRPGEHILRRYNKWSSDGRRYREIDLRKTGDNDRREDRPNLFYYFFFNSLTGELVPSGEETPPPGWIAIRPLREDGSEGNWRWEMSTARARIRDLSAKVMSVRKVWTVFEKDWLTDDERVKPTTAFTTAEINSERGPEDLIKLGFPKEVFPSPKPVGLLRLLEELVLEPDSNEVVLDFFAGSGTVGQATFALNDEDGGNRRFILVQLPEPTEGTYPTISSLTRERVRRSGQVIAKERAGKLALDNGEPPDLGFRAYRLTSSNFSPWDGDANNIESISRQIELFADNLVSDGSAEDILTEIMLKLGFELTEQVDRLTLAGKEAFSVAGGALLVCLDRALTLEVIEAMAERDPAQIICLDAGFNGNDQLKVNAAQTIKTRARSGDETIVFKVV